MKNKVRILVVEDDMIIAAHICLQLTNLDYEITGIETRGEEAVVHANVNTPDIILMDLSLPVIDGWEASRQKTESYVAGSWGPSTASTLLDRDGRLWHVDSEA